MRQVVFIIFDTSGKREQKHRQILETHLPEEISTVNIY